MCQTAIVYGRTIGDTTFTFGHEGVLYRNSFVMYDKQTDSLWVHTTGEAVKGKSKGKVLTFLPSVVTTWKAWKQLHPKTTVLTGKANRGFMGTLRLKQDLPGFGLSVGQGPSPKLYRYEDLQRLRVIQDEHGGRKIVVVFDAATLTARAFLRGEYTFAWKDGALKDGKGTPWGLLTGIRSGKGVVRLEPLPATTWRIRRWEDFHPRAPQWKAP